VRVCVCVHWISAVLSLKPNLTFPSASHCSLLTAHCTCGNNNADQSMH
jgi:hypothetical protein